MKNIRNKIWFLVIVIALSGTLTTMLTTEGSLFFTSIFDGHVYDGSGLPISGATIILRDSHGNVLSTKYSGSNGYYCIISKLTGYTPYTLRAVKVAEDLDQTLTVNGGGTYDFHNSRKIAVFFWASDAGTSTAINKYKGYMINEGYTKIFEFRDSSDVQADCATVDNYETTLDTVFVYIIGHGYNENSHSYTAFMANKNSVVASNTFRGYMDAWESTKKGILVESCHSGDWVDDFADSPYLAMSSSNETQLACVKDNILPGEGAFSYCFFYKVNAGYNDAYCFNMARNYVMPYRIDRDTSYYQDPKISDLSTYTFFS